MKFLGLSIRAGLVALALCLGAPLGARAAVYGTNGTVWAWGSGGNGRLGNNATALSSVPVAVNVTGVLAGKTVIAVAAGGSHSLALCADGTVAAWGDGGNGRLGNNATTDSLVPVAVNVSGVLAGKTVIAVAAGGSHSLALCADGTVAAWGDGIAGQLGNNATTESVVPVAVNVSGVLAGKTVIAVAAGGYHSVALCADGTVAAWGFGGYGRLGNNATTNSAVPVAVDRSGVLAGKTVTAVSAGGGHNLALCADGTVAAWGYGELGQLGNNAYTNSAVPVAVDVSGVLAGKTVIAVVAGGGHNLALCSDGTLAAWGYCEVGQLGNNAYTNSAVPVAVTVSGVLAGKTVIAVAAGLVHSLAVCADGTVAAWGYGGAGQLGNNVTWGSSVPVAVNTSGLPVGARFVGVVSGPSADHTLALVALALPTVTVTKGAASSVTSSGATVAGTVNAEGSSTVVTFEYGLTTKYGSTAPAAESPVTGISPTSVSAALTGLSSGTTYHYRVKGVNSGGTSAGSDATFTTAPAAVYGTNGTVWAWGYGFAGELGNNATAMSSVPVAVNVSGVLAGKTVTAVSAGQYHSLALCADGTVAAWGYGGNGRLGNNATTDSLVPVAVNRNGVLAGKTVIALAAGGDHSLALCADGTVAAWGYGIAGQLGNNATTESVVPVAVNVSGVLAGKTVIAVAAGGSHSLALCADGTVAAWGSAGAGHLGNNAYANSAVPVAVDRSGVLAGKTVTAVAAGYAHSLALCADGTVAAWGSGYYGELGNNAYTNSAVPVAVTVSGVLAGKTVIAVAAGGSHSLALCADGTVAAWGYGGDGQLGNNDTANSSVPVAVTVSGMLAGKTVIAVASGSSYSLALCADGTVAAWGRGLDGQLGNNATTNSSVPVAVSTAGLPVGTRFIRVVSGSSAGHSLALVALALPTVTKGAASSVTSSGATVAGTVNAEGSSTVVTFEYGLTTKYGSTAPAAESPVTGISPTSVSAALTGLSSGTTYHYRVKGVNSGGTSAGSDATFTTLPAPPVITAQPVATSFALGQGLTLSVTAGGIAPLSYQWQFNGTNIAGATSATLALTNLMVTNAGAYTVVVMNAGGSVTSAAADLSYFGDLKFYAGTVLAGAIGQQFRVDYADVLNSVTNWLPLTNVTLPSSPYLVIDPASPGRTNRYYRAVPLP